MHKALSICFSTTANIYSTGLFDWCLFGEHKVKYIPWVSLCLWVPRTQQMSESMPCAQPTDSMFSSTQMPMDIYKLGTIEINNLWPSGTINT